jgi:hypothetical protein
MNFSITRKLENGVFSTEVKCTSYGDTTLSATEEEALIADFGPVVVEVGGQLTGKCIISGKGVAIDPAGEEVGFILNSNKVSLKPELLITYSIDAAKISKEEIVKCPILKDAIKIAEARCVVFESTVKTKILESLTELKASSTSFETIVIDPFQA